VSRGASEIAARVATLYAEALPTEAGVVHVTSAWRGPQGELTSLAINHVTPASVTDRFVLALARARADALVTTGRILRSEPDLSHAQADDDALASWRREIMGRGSAPLTAVLSGGRGLDLDHPLLCGPQPRLIYTTPESKQRLADAAAARGIELVADPAPSLRRLLAWLRQEHGHRSVVVEAGATTSSELYLAPLGVDELLLSLPLSETLAGEAKGPALPDEPAIAAAGLRLQSECVCEEESGAWSFRRYCRR